MNFPLFTLDISRISLISDNRYLLDECILSKYSFFSCSVDSFTRFSSENPTMALSGVLRSWLILARKLSLASFEALATLNCSASFIALYLSVSSDRYLIITSLSLHFISFSFTKYILPVRVSRNSLYSAFPSFIYFCMQFLQGESLCIIYS